MESRFDVYYIDIVGTCNLRCPSCPVGNYKVAEAGNGQRPTGFMQLPLFKDILEKIKRESIGSHPMVIGVYNWGEPTLHPELPKFIEAIREKSFYSYVSTNLNVREDKLKELVAVAPDKLIVSTSGYDCDVYSQTHSRGDPHLVVSNMFRLRYYMDKLKKDFDVEISYHMYEHNIHKDIERIMSISQDLRFHLALDITFYMPLENNFKYFNGNPLPQKDRDLISLMLIKPEEQLELAQPYKKMDCPLLDYTTINFDGSTALCCGVYDYRNNIADNFLDVDCIELAERKKKHPLCSQCMGMGLHMAAAQAARSELDALVNERLKKFGSKIRKDDSLVRRHFFENSSDD